MTVSLPLPTSRLELLIATRKLEKEELEYLVDQMGQGIGRQVPTNDRDLTRT